MHSKKEVQKLINEILNFPRYCEPKMVPGFLKEINANNFFSNMKVEKQGKKIVVAFNGAYKFKEEIKKIVQ